MDNLGYLRSLSNSVRIKHEHCFDSRVDPLQPASGDNSFNNQKRQEGTQRTDSNERIAVKNVQLFVRSTSS